MSKHHVIRGTAMSLVVVAALALEMTSVPPVLGDDALLRADFDQATPETFAGDLFRNPHASFSSTEGPDGSGAVEVEYEGYDRGSRRVLLTVPLAQRVREATLSYDVRFCDGFRFVRGGKLHGLGPAQPVTGGNPVEPHRWSARVVFRRGGKLGAYVYAQDMGQKYGLSLSGLEAPLSPGVYYAVSLFVRLNEIGHADGEVAVYVDGEQILEADGLTYRASPDGRALISSFLFNTFHGGSSPAWAPLTDDGEYATECAHFDNISVREGRHVRVDSLQ